MLYIVLAATVILLDQFTKILVLEKIGNGTLTVINGIFNLTLVHNTGSAFGMFRDEKFLFLIITPLIVLAVITYSMLQKNKSSLLMICTSLIAGGAIGNYIDRLRLGYVVDFLDFKVWPVFNVADSCIVIGSILMLVYVLYTNKEKEA